MLDNPDEYGIYPTTKCFEQLDALFDSLSLPPAEGAENIRQLLLGWEHYKRDHFRESEALDVEAILMSEYVAAYDIWLSEEKMPMQVRAFCKCLNNDNCVVLNQDLSDEKKLEAVAHEVLHFKRKDLSKDISVLKIEQGMLGCK